MAIHPWRDYVRLKCKTGEYELSTGMLEAYAALHPTAEQEFAKMVIWLESNAASRPKTPKSAPRFIQNWFKRVPKRVQTKQDQRADTVRQLVGHSPRGSWEVFPNQFHPGGWVRSYSPPMVQIDESGQYEN